MNDKLWTRTNIRKNLGYEGPVIFSEHHESHAASAFFPSPFQEAAILTMDGVGEWATSSLALGKDYKIAKNLHCQSQEWVLLSFIIHRFLCLYVL